MAFFIIIICGLVGWAFGKVVASAIPGNKTKNKPDIFITHNHYHHNTVNNNLHVTDDQLRKISTR